MYAHGRYNSLAQEYLKDHGWQPEIQEGDMELLREARPDFMGVNYYATATVSAPKMTDMTASRETAISR